ncbi:BTB/POZ domain-containing protein [Rhizophagus clarus]|uniref:BTB/POZ domain-containing protein n=1 Tax=Rhizophagus clarus TaxID=94130 RepID=A0A8H3L884_9GLOM|nr:BTB/POZ domain-containing protein [Rhizophagus clarus]
MLQKLCVPVLNNFENLFNLKKNYDVVIQAGEENNEIYAHSVVLCCQSNYFNTAFSDNWAERKDGKFMLKKPNISQHILEIIIRYLYCGQLDLSVESASDILKLLIATEELGLNVLTEYIQEFLIENQNELLHNNPIEILEVVFQYEAFTKFKDNLLKIICQKPKILFGTDKILSLPAQILESLIKRNDLALDEIEVWDNLIKWAHAQHPTISEDPSKWTKDELTLMERILLKFIPLIRFHDITSRVYYNKVMPYEDLLPKKLRLEIMKFYLTSNLELIELLPSRSFFGTIDSVIISAKHLVIFSGWIDKKEAVLKEVPYEFNLIFRASRDGNTAANFHDKCDGKGANIVVTKIKGTNQIVGGYNPLDWNGSGSKSTPDSFIFTFDNISTGRIGRVINKSHAIRCYRSWGPLFGDCLNDSNDIMVTDKGKWSSVTNSYPNLGIPSNFEVDDYEVFQIVKRN